MKSLLMKAVLVLSLSFAGALASGCVIHAHSGDSKPKPAETRKAEPRKAEPRKAEPKQAEPEQADPPKPTGHRPPPPPPPSY